jgi:uncharacterized repeat protein (TIGR01451 family)
MRASRLRPRGAFLAAGLIGLAAGCLGGTQNPTSFPFYLPPGDIVRTHAKPPGHGYFADFDPHACRLEVRPMDACVPVRGQQVLIATVYDDEGKPRRKRRVEWIVEGPGNIIEVDESGYLPGRGYKVDNKYAVSYTDYFEHTITRGNADPNDDFAIGPGQSWCVISSASEGLTTVTVYAPEVHDWDRGRAFVKLHVVDANWQFPPPATARAGTMHVFATKVTRHSDQQPLTGYRVRYRLLDGPPAALFTAPGQANGGTEEAVAVTDAEGIARVNVQQIQPKFGISRVAVEVLQPDSNGPGGFTVVGRSETRIDWQAPQVSISIDAPKVAQLNQEVPVVFTVASTGSVDAQPVLLKAKVPEGVELVNSSEKATRDGGDALWSLPALPAGKQHTIQATFRPVRLGEVQLTASVPSADGQRAEDARTVQVTEAKLQVSLEGPKTAVVGELIPLKLTLANTGSGAAANVQLAAHYDEGLLPGSNTDPLEKRIPEVKGGDLQVITLPVVPNRPGRLSVRLTAQADGNVVAQAQPYQVEVLQPRLTVDVSGPPRCFLNQEVTWKLRVTNPGEVGLANVVLRAELPGEITFKKAANNGKLERDQVVVWNLGTPPPKAEIVVEVTGVCAKLADRALLTADVTAEPLVSRDGQFQPAAMARGFGAEKPAQVALEILGVPALQLEVSDANDPIDVGQRSSYTIRVRNTGTLTSSQVEVTAEVPQQMRPLRAYGPIGGRIDGQKVTFPAINGVQPGNVVSYTIEVEAISAGDAIFRAEMRSVPLTTPIRVEEPTKVLPRATFTPVPQPKR